MDVDTFRQLECKKCDKYAGKRKTKLTFGKTYCLATDKEITGCDRKRLFKKGK